MSPIQTCAVIWAHGRWKWRLAEFPFIAGLLAMFWPLEIWQFLLMPLLTGCLCAIAATEAQENK